MHGMDWDDLRVFLAVARAGRLAVAARQLGVEHTTVGRRIAALEAELGAALFYRTAAGHRLTAPGERLLPAAEAMERAALAAQARAREAAGAIAGRVRVALVEELAAHWLAPRLPAFRREHPAIELQILVGVQVLDLSRGEAELAVRTPRPRQPGLSAVRLGSTAFGLYASRAWLGKRRLRVDGEASARGLPLLVYTAPHAQLQSAAWFQPALGAADVVLTTNSTETLLAGALAGAGVAVLPHLIAQRRDDLVAVSADVGGSEVWLVTHPEYRRDPAVRATAAFLRGIASELV